MGRGKFCPVNATPSALQGALGPRGARGSPVGVQRLLVQSWPINPLTPKGDQFRISPAASPEIFHYTVWRTWLFIAYSDERWLCYQFSLPFSALLFLKLISFEPNNLLFHRWKSDVATVRDFLLALVGRSLPLLCYSTWLLACLGWPVFTSPLLQYVTSCLPWLAGLYLSSALFFGAPCGHIICTNCFVCLFVFLLYFFVFFFLRQGERGPPVSMCFEDSRRACIPSDWRILFSHFNLLIHCLFRL